MIYAFFVREKMNFVFAEMKIPFAETLNHGGFGRIDYKLGISVYFTVIRDGSTDLAIIHHRIKDRATAKIPLTI